MLTNEQKRKVLELATLRRQVYGHMRVNAAGRRSLVRPHYRMVAALRRLLRK